MSDILSSSMMCNEGSLANVQEDMGYGLWFT